jgi:predicted hydrolase (HD superfamily)
MRAYAARYGADPETWGAAGMLHDFDYEMHPAAPQHPMKGGEILLARGVSADVVHAVLAHADYSGYPRVSLLDHGLYACDELSGFITACALVRPGRAIAGLEPGSVKKKLKDRASRAPSTGRTSIAAPRSWGDLTSISASSSAPSRRRPSISLPGSPS